MPCVWSLGRCCQIYRRSLLMMISIAVVTPQRNCSRTGRRSCRPSVSAISACLPQSSVNFHTWLDLERWYPYSLSTPSQQPIFLPRPRHIWPYAILYWGIQGSLTCNSTMLCIPCSPRRCNSRPVVQRSYLMH